MAGALGALNILLGLDTRTFTEALTKSGYDAQKFARSFEAQMRRVDRSTQGIGRGLSRNLSSSNRAALQLSANMAQAFATAKVRADAFNASMQQVQASALGLTRAFAGAIGAVEIVKAADAYGQMASRLKGATDNAQEFKQIQDQLYDVSNRTYKRAEDAQELFIRTRQALKQMGVDAKQTADLVSTVQFGLTLDSASPERTKSAIDAISNSILQGKVSMQDFNRIVSASPTLFQALADSIAGGSQKALRQMVADGKLTADQLLKVTDQMQKLGRAADDMPTSVGDAFIKLQNNITRYIGETDSATGATGQLVSAVDFAADHVSQLADAFLLFGGFKISQRLVGTTAGVAKSVGELTRSYEDNLRAAVQRAKADQLLAQVMIGKARTENQAFEAERKHTRATQQLSIAQKELAENTGLAARSGRLLRSGFASIGGWPTMIAAALTVGVAAYSEFSDRNKSLIGDNERLKLTTDQYIESLRKLTDVQRENEANAASIQAANLLDEIGGKGSRNTWSTFWGDFMRSPNLDFRQLAEQVRQIGYEATQSGDTIGQLDTRFKEFNKSINDGSQRSQNYLFGLREIEANIISLASKYYEATQRSDLVNASLKEGVDAAASAANTYKDFADSLNVSTQEAMDFTDELANQAEYAGLSAAAVAELQALAKGASQEEAARAGELARRTEEQKQNYKDYADAIKNKDDVAAASAENAINKTWEMIDALRVAQVESAATARAIAAMPGEGIKPNTDEATARIAQETKKDLQDLAKMRAAEDKARQQTLADIRSREERRPSIARPARRAGGGVSRTSARAVRAQESEIQRMLKSLKEEQDQLGMTNLEQQLYKIGKAEGAQALKDEAAQIARNISARKEQLEVEKQQRLLQRELADFRDQQEFDYLTAGIGEQSRDYLRKQLDIQNEYNRQRRQLEENQLSESSRISDEAYQAQVAALDQAEQDKLAILAASNEKKRELDLSWVAGAKEAMQNYIDGATDVNSQFENMFTNAIGGIENAFTDFVLTGKAGWKDMIDSMIKDLMRFAVRYAVMAPIFQGLTRILPSIGSPGSTMINTIGLASGGYVRGPGTGTSDSIPAWLSNGEAVLTAREVKALGGAVGFDALRRMIARYGAATPLQIRQTFPGLKRNMPAFANGGIVGNAGASAGTPLNNGGTVNVNVIDQTTGGIAATSANYDVESQVLNIVVNDIHRGGRVAKAVKGAM